MRLFFHNFPTKQPVLFQQQSTTGNATTFKFDLYSQLVTGLNAPFIVVFGALFFISVISYGVQFKNLKRNNHILFILQIALAAVSVIQIVTRIGSELAFLITDQVAAFHTNNVIKSIDRSMASVIIYIQLVILIFISHAL